MLHPVSMCLPLLSRCTCLFMTTSLFWFNCLVVAAYCWCKAVAVMWACRSLWAAYSRVVGQRGALYGTYVSVSSTEDCERGDRVEEQTCPVCQVGHFPLPGTAGMPR